MMTQRRIQLLAASIIAAGGFFLSSPSPVSAAAFDGCSDGLAAVSRRQQMCSDAGGSFSVSFFSCDSQGYSFGSSCAFQVAPPP